MTGDPIQEAISSFAALPLLEKIASLAAAAIKVEKDLEKNGRVLGHPGDRPSDYLEAVGSEMLGLRWTESIDEGALISGGCPAFLLLKRAGISLSAVEENVLVESIGVIASAAPENQFACIIDGHELNPDKPNGLAFPDAIRQHGLFAKMLQTSGAYNKVFVASFSFVDALSPDLLFSDRLFDPFCYLKKQFQYARADIAVYAAGVEFPC